MAHLTELKENLRSSKSWEAFLKDSGRTSGIEECISFVEDMLVNDVEERSAVPTINEAVEEDNNATNGRRTSKARR